MNTRLCFALAVPLIIAVMPSQVRAADRWGGIDRWTPVSDTRLAQARGGFDIGNGLMASFGFDRTITINGVTTTIANVQIPDIAKMTEAQAKALEAATRASLVQNGPDNAVSAPIVASPAPGAAAGTPVPGSVPSTSAGTSGAAAVASAGTPASATATGTAAPAPAKATTPASIAAAAVAAPAVAAATQAIGNSATVIQNSLDNQTIQSSTTLSTSVNTLSTFHNINFQAGLQDALIRSR